ncbi:NAD-dependent epimerase/dehydratase family protein [Halomonas rhizosphaerae]|uniref:NAD-dependent epimerase/dehydratase family protein n=1 Tax=Halomonas rhizosphaerae TaxID=3043296 RepID=A0ABT6UX82_9GAMM|nr:NAD-dependent epimerase/dehydratase family protein [Halomonas rhizosphaerae]MDI5890276.1 NAD-dependent epimerase/dehydratase family protein [Halomonas rhizosphaerae]
MGGSGFIGTRLCRRLTEHQSQFSIVDKAESAHYREKVERADVRSVEALRDAVPEGSVLINLAAEHRDDVRPKSLYDEVNVADARNLCQVAREKRIQHIVFTSSVAVYGFAPAGTDESGEINYFNDYGRTKWLAEGVFKEWQAEDPDNRTLVIVRPTVVFGEQNRGNVYNLLRQIASGKFVMIGDGKNTKSMAYVENVAAFLEHSLTFKPGVHIHNYIDKPDFDMNTLVGTVRKKLGKGASVGLRLPYVAGLACGYTFDAMGAITRRSFPVSSIRVKKFCATTQFATNIADTGFEPPLPLAESLERTLQHEFLEDHQEERVFFTE